MSESTQPRADGEAAHTQEILLACYCHKAFADALDAIAHADVHPANAAYLTKGRMAEIAVIALRVAQEFRDGSASAIADHSEKLAFIVRACDSHAALVSRLESMRESLDNIADNVASVGGQMPAAVHEKYGDFMFNLQRTVAALADDARSTLQLAGGGAAVTCSR